MHRKKWGVLPLAIRKKPPSASIVSRFTPKMQSDRSTQRLAFGGKPPMAKTSASREWLQTIPSKSDQTSGPPSVLLVPSGLRLVPTRHQSESFDHSWCTTELSPPEDQDQAPTVGSNCSDLVCSRVYPRGATISQNTVARFSFSSPPPLTI